MTRKHFQLLADLVAAVPSQGIGPVALAEALADICSSQNDRFDRATFLKACKLPESAVNA